MNLKELKAAIAAEGADVDKLLKDYTDGIVKEVYDNVDKTLPQGFKVDGMKTLTAVEKLAKAHSAANEQITNLSTQLESTKGKVPEIETLRSTHAAELEKVRTESQKELINLKREIIITKANALIPAFTFDEKLSERAKALARLEIKEMFETFEVEEQGEDLILKKDGLILRDEKSAPITVKSKLTQAVNPFLAQTTSAPTPPPAGGKPNSTSVTTQDKIAWAKANGVDVTTSEGLKQVAEQFAPTK